MVSSIKSLSQLNISFERQAWPGEGQPADYWLWILIHFILGVWGQSGEEMIQDCYRKQYDNND